MEDYVFHEVGIEDKAWIKARLAEDDGNSCERSFSTIFLYRKLYHVQAAEMAGCCVIRCMYKTMKEHVPYWTYYFPIGAGNKRAALEAMLELCRREEIPLHLEPILANERELLLEWFPGRFLIESNRDCYDYVYSREKLAFLKGKKMQKKRNHIARFKDDEDWSYEPITRANLAETRFMARSWIGSRAEKWNEDMENEFSVLEDAFANYEAIGLKGGLLRRHGEIVAFTMGEPLNSNTFLVHFEKAFPEVHGAYPMINQQFVQQGTEGFEYINREDDVGDLGLRKAKLSYYPEILLKKYVAETCDVVMADPVRDREAVHAMWEQCFGDSPEFIDFYITRRMSELNMLVIYRDGRAVSMASFLPTDIQTAIGNLEGFYVYAVATLPEYQGQGLSSKILQFAQRHWQKPLILSPAEPGLRIFYAKRGFQPVYDKKFYALQPCRDRAAAEAELKPATAREYKAVRDAKWQGPGYVAWLEEDIAYAMEHTAFQQGETLLVRCCHEDNDYQDCNDYHECDDNQAAGGKQAAKTDKEKDKDRGKDKDKETDKAQPEQHILMYTLDGDTMRIVESTLNLCQLPGLLPLLVKRAAERHPDNKPVRNFEYRLPDGMVWIPERLKTTRLKRRGYFNLALD